MTVRLSRPSAIPWAVSAVLVVSVAGIFLFAVRPAPPAEAPEARRILPPLRPANAVGNTAPRPPELPRDDVLFSCSFGDGKRPAIAASGSVVRGPENRLCLAGDPDPGGTSRVSIGDNERGLFSYQGNEVLSFDYWVDVPAGSVSFHLWNRTQKRTQDGFAPHVVTGKWTAVTFRLADLAAPDGRAKEGDAIAYLNLQGSGTPPCRFYVDNIRITRPRALKPRGFATK
jgi:hypothetical protein